MKEIRRQGKDVSCELLFFTYHGSEIMVLDGGAMDTEIEKKGSTVMKVTHPTSARKNPEGEIS